MRALRAAAILIGLIVAACDSTVTEADLQKWTNNEIGVRRLKEVVVDAKQPRGTRIRALEVLVEKRLAPRVKPMVQAIPDKADAEQLARDLVTQLEQHVQQNSAHVLDAKDTILELTRYLTPTELDKAQRIISAWAFSDITWETPAREVRQKVEKRMSAAQIVAMGKYATQVGGILVSHGFVVDQMLHYLVALKTPEAFDLVVRGLKALQAKIGVRTTDVAALRAIGTSAGAAMLFEIYQNPQTDSELRDNAYNFAVEMLELPEVKKAPAEVATQLTKIMGTPDADDRWSGAANLVRLLGPAAKFNEIMAVFKDDGVYTKGTDETGKSVMDFCLDLQDLNLKAGATPVLRDRLANGNRIQKAIAIVCLKALGVQDVAEDFRTLAKNIDKPEDVALEDFLGPKMTLGKLAQNAVDGLAAIARIDADKAAGKLNEEQHKNKRLGAVVEFELIGDEYAKAVEERYLEWLKEQQAPAPKPPAPGGAPPAPAPGGTAPAPAPGATAPAPAPGGTAPAPAPGGTAPAPAPGGAAPAPGTPKPG